MSAGQGRASRYGIGVMVAVSSVLALVALLAVNWLAGRPGIRARWDLTRAEQNTLSTATRGVLDRLEEDVEIHVLFRPGSDPRIAAVVGAVQVRTNRMLALFRDSSRDRIELIRHDLSDASTTMQVLNDLGLVGWENCIVVRSGQRREVLRLSGDLAVLDGGQPPPDPRPASIISFDAESSIVTAILEVTSGDQLDVYFTVGLGEASIVDDGPTGLSRLERLLAEQGLRVNRWNPVEDGALPEDCACLAIMAPRAQLSADVMDAVEAYVRKGGRLVVAPAPSDDALAASRIGELTERFGLEVLPGIVCQPVLNSQFGTLNVGLPEVSQFYINPARISQHPMLAPIRENARTFRVSGSHPVRRVRQPERGHAAMLFTSEHSPPMTSWIELMRTGDTPWNWEPDPDEQQNRPVDLGAAVVLDAELDTPAALEERPEGRMVLLGSAVAFQNALADDNQDLLNNIFNWVLDREFRLLISPRDPHVVKFPPDAQDSVTAVNRIAFAWIPLSCVLAGVLTALLRARGGPDPRTNE